MERSQYQWTQHNGFSFITTCLFALMIIASNPVHADMSLDRLIVDFNNNSRHYEDIQVFNQGDKELYVNVSVAEVLSPGSDKEKRVSVNGVVKRPLVVSPSRLVIPANSRKSVRILTMEEASGNDRIFRVDFSPALGKLKAKASGIKLLVAYQALVMVRPENPVVDIKTSRQGEFLVFRNQGNTNVLLQNGRQCNPQSPKDCQELKTRRLYAGNEWRLQTPFNGPVTYDLDFGDRVETRTFGGNTKPKVAALIKDTLND